MQVELPPVRSCHTTVDGIGNELNWYLSIAVILRSDKFMNMNAVGIDVSKGKSMVAILRPLNIILFEIMEKRSNTTLKISWGFILFIHVWEVYRLKLRNNTLQQAQA